jgi:uncharacterized protein (DUF488 family)
MDKIKLFTIGFTKKTAEQFFNKLQLAGVRRIIDIRLNNVSQLAGFAKRDDLKFFLRAICDIDYIHEPKLAPTKEILDEYKKNKGDWSVYEKKFIELMHYREVEKILSTDVLNFGCFLCSEDKPDKCHRRLVAEFLNEKSGNVDINHL